MKVTYVDQPTARFLEPRSDLWRQVAAVPFNLIPTPIKMAEQVSPFMAESTDHGKISLLESRIAHNGKAISIQLSWKDATRNDEIKDLDQFIDGVAVMFPFTAFSNPLTMGDQENPVNAWMWRADQAEPFDVIARGYGSSVRRSGKESGLLARSSYQDGHWTVVFQRALRAGLISRQQVSFAPLKTTGIAFAVWDGGGADRSAQKSFSGPLFEPLELVA